jgi:protein-tyrosine-phosphatase
MSWQDETRQLRQDRRRGFLFLCVANSARSQLAEGIARHLVSRLPADQAAAFRIASAGSHPTRVRPEAVAVLQEIGIDIGAQHSKNVADIPPETVDVVITLCAEEECPVFLGQAQRLHWPLPDPASDQGTLEDRLPAFRAVRDELRRRLEAVFGGD